LQTCKYIIGDGNFLVCSSLGSYKYDSVGSSCTVNGLGRGILQYLDGLYIPRIKIVDVVYRYTIDNKQGGIASGK